MTRSIHIKIGDPAHPVLDTTYNFTVFKQGTAGADTLHATFNSPVLFGNGGNDVLISDPLVLSPSPVPPTVQPFFASAFLSGGDGNDRLTGGGAPDVLSGDAGNDTIFGGAGSFGNNDTISGGAGNDVITTSLGSDLVSGGLGDDTIFLGGTVNGYDTTKFDIAYGDAGNDKIYAGVGNSELHGGWGNDFLRGGSGGRTVIYGDEGNDTIVAGSGVDPGYRFDLYDGGAGRDTFNLSLARQAEVFGGQGADIFQFAPTVQPGTAGSTLPVGPHEVIIKDFNVQQDTLLLTDLSIKSVFSSQGGTASAGGDFTSIFAIKGNEVFHITLVGVDGNEWQQANVLGGNTL